MTTRQWLKLVMAAAIACSGLPVMSQAYPTQPITRVAPFAPGGVGDTTLLNPIFFTPTKDCL
jgi:tripartite-type tricarboxylate transporter receptor subunit TctC